MSSKKVMLPTIPKGVPRLLNVNREPSRPKKRRKITITFDEAKRKEFLTGFQKRNIERRAKAKERLKEKLQAEKKRITEEAKAKFKTYLSQRDIPELEELLAKHEYETDGKTVSILELDVKSLTQSANWIGENRPVYEEEDLQSEKEDDIEDEDIVPGMEIKQRTAKKTTQPENTDGPQMSKKDIAKEIMRKTHKSKLFKRKQQYESSRNKKRAAREKKKQERMLKHAKGKTKIKLERQMMKKNNNNRSFSSKKK